MTASLSDLPEIARHDLERVAAIIGPQSAAAQAMADADTHDGPTRFLRAPGSIIVEKLPQETQL